MYISSFFRNRKKVLIVNNSFSWPWGWLEPWWTTDFSNRRVCLLCFWLAFLPLHLQRTNYIWKLTSRALLILRDISDCGWNEDSRNKWIQQLFPEDITDLLMGHNDYDDDYKNIIDYFGGDSENDDDGVKNWD